MAEQDIPPPTITAMKIPIIRKGEYDIWSMRMRQYICHTDHNLWDVIVNGDLEEEPAPTGDQSGPSAPPAPKTAKQLAARRNQERVKSILLLAIPVPTSLLEFWLLLSSENTSILMKFKLPASGDFGVVVLLLGGYVDCQSKEVHSEDRHFARECRSRRNQGRRSYGDNGRSNAPTNESSSQALVAQDGLGGYDWSNDFEIEPVNYTLMEISSSSSSSSSDSEIDRDRVIIEDWNSDDEEEVSEVQIVRPETQSGQHSKKQGIGFRKVKACFVCKSNDHLIKGCNFHDNKGQEP
ncbi:hypothetical protein Tco_1124506 [Tanacetum coccineum]|uniref:Uncharacterized protein n=1 Tax=Tanacetum coccineum TaxID=301880 RepID=A0ABQ5J7F8_9ASTR